MNNNNTIQEIQMAEMVVAIIITGWDLYYEEKSVVHHHKDDVGMVDNVSLPQTVPYMQCLFCLSRQPVPVIDHNNSNSHNHNSKLPTDHNTNGSDDDNNNNNKRQRTNNIPSTISSKWNQPYMAHRYYCPWVCGFPMTKCTNTTGTDTTNTNSTDRTKSPSVMEPTMGIATGPTSTFTFSLPLWQVMTNRLLMEAQMQQQQNQCNEKLNTDENHNNYENHDISDSMVQNVLAIHQQIGSSISPLRYKS
jgi:hypothetical protein